MRTSPVSIKEGARLAALRRLEILDTHPEDAFDDFTQIASMICEVPIALISLIDEDRQWFKSKVGLDVSETPRNLAFCSHAILGTSVMVVNDATLDSRFSDNPLVTSDPGIRFYAGAPLIDEEGFGLGTLCVIDRRPRQPSARDLAMLELLAKRVVAQMTLKKISSDLASALKDVAALEELIPICAYCKSIRDDKGYWNRLENYFKTKADMDFTHGICPDCAEKHYRVICDEIPPARSGQLPEKKVIELPA